MSKTDTLDCVSMCHADARIRCADMSMDSVGLSMYCACISICNAELSVTVCGADIDLR